MPITLVPVNEEEAVPSGSPVALVPVDPLADFAAYNAIEDEKEARGYDPADPGVARKLWSGAKAIMGDVVGAGEGLADVALGLGPGGNPAEAGALASAAVGKFMGNYAVLGEGVMTAVKRAAYAGRALIQPETEAEMKQLSRKAAWEFQREAREVEDFTDKWNQNLETIYPEALRGLGSIPVDGEAARGLAMVADPANYVPAGAAARWTTKVPLRGAVRAAEVAVKEAAREMTMAGVQRETATLLVKPGMATAAREQARTLVLEAGDRYRQAQARHGQARAALTATTQEQTALVEALASEAAQLPMVTRATSAAAQGGGVLLQRGGEMLERAAALPDRLAQAVAGGADEAAQQAIASGVRNVLGGFGVVSAATGLAGRTAANVGRNLAVFGRQLAEAESQLPFFKRLARETDGLTKFGASLVDESGMGEVVATWGRIGADATRGLPFAAGMGYASSGGETDGAFQGMGGGAVFGLAGAGYGQWRRYATGSAFRQRLAGDVGRYKQTLPTEETRAFFNKQTPSDQAALATMQLAHPDLRIQYSKLGADQPSFYYAADDGPVAVVNLDSRSAIPAVVAHEIGHHVERHGLGPSVSAVLLGDPLAKRPGLFTEMDAAGKPVLNADGTYALNAEFSKLRAAYNARLAPLSEKMGEAVRPRTDAQIAGEIFAEQTAGYLLGSDGQLARDLRSNVWSRAIAGLAGSELVANVPTVRALLGKLGAPLEAQSKRVAGSGLFSEGVPASPELSRLISRYHRQSARGAVTPLGDEPGGTRYTIGEVLQHPDILDKLFDGSDDVRRDGDGKVMRDKAGRPIFTTAAEQKANRAELASAISGWFERNPSVPSAEGAARPAPRYEKVSEGGKVQEGWVVPTIPDGLISDLQAAGKFNPVQIEHLRIASQLVRDGRGQSALFFYQPASKAGSSASRRGLAGDWRAETPYAIFISKQGNVLLRTVSREKLMANAQDLIGSKRGQLWNNNLGEVVRDVDRYLANHAEGRPGADGIGMEKRDQINALFGIGTKANVAANPLLESSPKAPIVIRSRRLDRINRLTSIEQTFPTNYDKLNRNLRPEDVETGGQAPAKTAVYSYEHPDMGGAAPSTIESAIQGLKGVRGAVGSASSHDRRATEFSALESRGIPRLAPPSSGGVGVVGGNSTFGTTVKLFAGGGHGG